MMKNIIPLAPGSTLPVGPQVPNFAELIDQLLQVLKSVAPVDGLPQSLQEPATESLTMPVRKDLPVEEDPDSPDFEDDSVPEEAGFRRMRDTVSDHPVAQEASPQSTNKIDRPVQPLPKPESEPRDIRDGFVPAGDALDFLRLLTPQVVPVAPAPVEVQDIPDSPLTEMSLTSFQPGSMAVLEAVIPQTPVPAVQEPSAEPVPAGIPGSESTGAVPEALPPDAAESPVAVAQPQLLASTVPLARPEVTRDPTHFSGLMDSPAEAQVETSAPSGSEVLPATQEFMMDTAADEDGQPSQPSVPEGRAAVPAVPDVESAPPPAPLEMKDVLDVEVEEPASPTVFTKPAPPSDSKDVLPDPEVSTGTHAVSVELPELVPADPAQLPVRFVSLQTDGEARVSLTDGEGMSVPSTAAASKSAARVARPETPPQTPSTDFVDRIVKASRLTEMRGQTKIKIVLNPPHLGYLRVDLVVKDHVLHGTLQTDTAAARELILSNLHHLKDSLEQQGVKVGEFEILSQQAQDQPQSRAGQESPESRDEDPLFFPEEPVDFEESEPGRGLSSVRLHAIDVLA